MSAYLPQSAVIWTPETTLDTLTCVSCGCVFEPPQWQPRLRCPQCEVLGYPDRAGRNLLPLDWECQSCGATNDARFNFCLNCGAGLATRCLHCEHPVYTAVCDHCGAAQSRVAHLEATENQRQTWVPELRQRILQQRLQAEVAAHQIHNPSYGVSEWRAIDAQWQQATQNRQTRHATVRASRRRWWSGFWGWAGVLAGVAALIISNHDLIASAMGPASQQVSTWFAASVTPLLLNANTDLGVWWQSFAASFGSRLDKNDPWYAYLFATGVFGLAVLPALIYLWGRLIKRLFH